MGQIEGNVIGIVPCYQALNQLVTDLNGGLHLSPFGNQHVGENRQGHIYTGRQYRFGSPKTTNGFVRFGLGNVALYG